MPLVCLCCLKDLILASMASMVEVEMHHERMLRVPILDCLQSLPRLVAVKAQMATLGLDGW